jgi:two-component system chemotaxis response regulator CheB
VTVGRDGRLSLNDDPPERGVRPSVNVAMESLVAVAGDQVVAAVLTGMGSDGTRGAGMIKQAGGYVIAEAESSCVVYGMPRAVVDAGFADELLPLDKIADAIIRQCVVPRSA